MATEEGRNASPEEPERRRIGRRGLLRGIGASALATAAVVFGTGRSAEAVRVACCDLGTTAGPWSTCASRPANDRYIWRCRLWTPYGACYRAYKCCDAGRTPWGTWTISAAIETPCY